MLRIFCHYSLRQATLLIITFSFIQYTQQFLFHRQCIFCTYENFMLVHTFFSVFFFRGVERVENYSIITIKSLLVWIFMTWFFASSVFISSPDWIFFLFASQSFWEVQRIFSAISFLLFLEIFSCFWLIKYRWHLEIWLIHVIHLDL